MWAASSLITGMGWGVVGRGKQALSHMPPPGEEEPELGGSWAAWSPRCGGLTHGQQPPLQQGLEATEGA